MQSNKTVLNRWQHLNLQMATWAEYTLATLLTSDIPDMDEKIISLCLYAVSLILVYEILSYVTYKYRNKIEEFKGFANEVGIIINDEP